MIFGSFVVAFCLIILGWTTEIVGWFVTDPAKVHFDKPVKISRVFSADCFPDQKCYDCTGGLKYLRGGFLYQRRSVICLPGSLGLAHYF